MVHPVPGTVLKIPGTPDQATVIADNQAKMRSL
ncbi:ydcA domain protein, partial [Escherichia coli p0305293.10]